MMLPIAWTPSARMQLTEMYEFVSESNVAAAEKQLETVIEAVTRLAGFPELGRKGRCSGTRELVVHGTPYVIAYRIRLRTIEVLAVIHGARRWPRNFGN